MTEKEEDHRHSMESAQLQESVNKSKRVHRYALVGLALAFVLSAGAIFGGVTAILAGYELVGGILCGIPPVASLFIYGRSFKK